MWQSVFKSLPDNNQIVWIRVLNIYGQITLAQYDSSKQEFEVIETGIVIPVFFVARWKPQ